MPPVNPERHRRIKSIVHAALELDPAEQAAFVEKTCRDDPGLEEEVRSLLAHDRESAGFLETPAVEARQAAFRLAPGSRLGPYEIVEPIGAGGMGEVYRAHDPRFGRDVAIKLLPAAFAHDEGRLARFEREARAAGSLNHPNVLTVHDFGFEAGAPYLVSELLRGETLRRQMEQSRIAPAKAVAYAAQIARGLGAAHAAGIVHRDLKPENVFVAPGGLVKILDFGVAKLPDLPGTARDGTPGTEPGTVLGTVGYMSPEQVRGEPAGHRSDIFSLGVILYEMLSGKRPFAGETWVDESNAILRQEAPDLPPALAGIPDLAVLNRILRRCLAKQAEDRFESARDLAFALESTLEHAGPKPRTNRLRRALFGAAAAAALAIGVFLAIVGTRGAPSVDFKPLTFRHGIVSAARFTADGNTIVYSAAWDGGDFRLYSTRPDSPESTPLALPDAMLLAVSSHGDLAMCIPTARTQHGLIGNLALAPLSGAGWRERAGNVAAADWLPDGSDLAVVRVENDRSQIEYPITHVRKRFPAGYIESLRVSPRGDAIAFLEHPLTDDSAGWVAMIDPDGKNYRKVSSTFNSMRGLAWSRDGGEVWFAAARQGIDMAVWAANRSRPPERLVYRLPAYGSVEDISHDRRALLSFHHLTESMIHAAAAGEPKDLYWHDQSQVRDISRDGKTILFSESGGATGDDYEAYRRATDGSSPAVRLGAGLPLSLSPDGGWVIANPAGSLAPLTLLPANLGEKRTLAADAIHHVGAAWLPPDGKRFVFAGISGEGLRYYVQSLQGGGPQPIAGPDIHYERRSPIVASPDGGSVAVVGNDGRLRIYPTAPGVPHPIPGLEPGYTPLQWCQDGRLVLHRYDEPQPKLWKVDIRTGKLDLWKQLNPPDPVGLLDITPIRIGPDCQSYAYSPLNVLSQAYLTTGLR
jgi:WD40 repeat protein